MNKSNASVEKEVLFFYSWYLKCQSDAQTLAVTPAIHNTGNKRT